MDHDGVVFVERLDGLATVVLNRPDKLNALNKEMWATLGPIFIDLHNDETVRCVVLRGAGHKALGPGADIKEFELERANSSKASEYGKLMHNAMTAIAECRHPVIARIQGLCVGGALELAAVCDLRIASDNSRFGIPVNRLGLVMSHYEMAGLIELVGKSIALEILFEGRIFDAEEAYNKGLLNKVVLEKDIDLELGAMVERICAGAPLVNRWHKRFAQRIVRGLSVGGKLSEDEILEGYECFDTLDFQEGYKAFLEKREPQFSGE